jgi:hypothetical protein
LTKSETKLQQSVKSAQKMAVIKEMIRAIIECMDDLEIRIDDTYRTLEEQDRGYFLWLLFL